jgi:hypothetical protein
LEDRSRIASHMIRERCDDSAVPDHPALPTAHR